MNHGESEWKGALWGQQRRASGAARHPRVRRRSSAAAEELLERVPAATEKFLRWFQASDARLSYGSPKLHADVERLRAEVKQLREEIAAMRGTALDDAARKALQIEARRLVTAWLEEGQPPLTPEELETVAREWKG